MRPLALLIVLALLPGAWGQSHAHEGGAPSVVVHDTPDDGRAVVGGLAHFGFALLEEGRPRVHRDAAFEVVQEGVTVFRTAEAHEYDGLFSFGVVFTRPGPYEVRATSEGFEAGVFAGEAVLPSDPVRASVVFEPGPTDAFGLVSGTVSIVDESGDLLPHTDALLEVRDAEGLLVSRVHAHIHEAPIAFQQGFARGGDYTLQVTAYQAFADGRGRDVLPAVATFPLAVGPLPPGVAGAPLLLLPESRPLSPEGPRASAGGLTVQGMYDPQQLVRVGAPARLAAVVVDEAGAPVPHVDFSFRLSGPHDLVFESETLHEYDGVFEFVFAPALPGLYEATLVARRDGVEVPVSYLLHVAPPVAPLSPGSFAIDLAGVDEVRAGEPVELTFSARGPTGPLAHAEFDVTIGRAGEVPVQQFKLHTHESGTAHATVAFPEAGDWVVHVDPIVLLPQASFVSPVAFAVPVAEGAADDAGQAAPMDPVLRVPAAGWAPLALLVAALALRRRP